MFFQVSQLKAGIPEAVEVELTYPLAIYRHQCRLILCSLDFQPAGDVRHSDIFACHWGSWGSHVFSYCKLVDLQHCCQQFTNNAILDPSRNVCLSVQTQRALDLLSCAIFRYIDQVGRKPVLFIGAIGMALCHFIIAAIFAKNEDQWPTHKAAGWAAVAMVWLFVIHFGYCMFSRTWF